MALDRKTVLFVARRSRAAALAAGLFLLFGSIAAEAQTRLWVHVNYLGEYVNSLCFIGGALPKTARMELIDANGSRLTISPYGCIDSGTYPVSCPRGGTWRTFSAWGIDQISSTEETATGWYPIELPAGYHPIYYLAGCLTEEPFRYNGTNFCWGCLPNRTGWRTILAR